MKKQIDLDKAISLACRFAESVIDSNIKRAYHGQFHGFSRDQIFTIKDIFNIFLCNENISFDEEIPEEIVDKLMLLLK